jgi:hypothetical protein
MTTASLSRPPVRRSGWLAGVLLGGLLLAFGYFLVISSRLPGVTATGVDNNDAPVRHHIPASTADLVMGWGAVLALVALVAAVALLLLRRLPQRVAVILLAVAVVCTLPAGIWFAAVAAVYSLLVIRFAPSR